MLSFKFTWLYVDEASVVFSPPSLPCFYLQFGEDLGGKGGGGVEEKLGWHRGTQIRLWMWSCQNGIIYFSQNDSTTDEDDDGDDDDDEEVVTILPEDKYRMGSLEKMISVMALLVEESRGER